MLAFRPGVVFMVIVASACVAVTGCARGEHENITSMRPYADVVGVEYEVIVDDLYGYGIYASRENFQTSHKQARLRRTTGLGGSRSQCVGRLRTISMPGLDLLAPIFASSMYWPVWRRWHVP